jgi:hypothetical protein
MARWYSANVLQTNPGGRRLWQLSAAGNSFSVQAEKTLLLNESAPPDIAAKDWHTLFRGKLNIAWLPADKIFLRAVQLPTSDPAEVSSMVELQLEKLSPLPVTHIVWSTYLMPLPVDKPDALQTVVVIIAARSAVEDFLRQLEGEGFLPDRLEAPGLEQLLAAKINGDGVWIVPGALGENVLVVWWSAGTIQNLNLVALSSGPERGLELKTQLEQIAWSGELEGWLSGPPKIYLLVGSADAAFWEPVFKDWGEQLKVIPPASPKELAVLSAQRCASNSSPTSLLPADYSARYHQQFVDRLWMRSLMTVLGVYIVGVLFYFGMLYVFNLKDTRVKQDLAALGNSYTNSQRDIAQIALLKERETLKYAALDCWKAVAENLPDSLTLENMDFLHGKLELSGTVTAEDQDAVFTFNERMRHVLDSSMQQPLFTDVTPPTTSLRGTSGQWRFVCVLPGAAPE